MNVRMSLVLAGILLAGLPAGVRGQVSGISQISGVRSFDLATLQQAAVDTDPRMQQFSLLTTQTDLRLRNIAALRLPTVTIEGQGQFQTDVAHLTPEPPIIGGLFRPRKDTYDGSLRIDQRLFDPTVDAQGALERAQLAENQARVRTNLFTQRQQVNDAFFAAAALQARAGSLAATISDLTARLEETSARVREGTALPADASAIEATLLQRQQDADDLQASRRAALDRLATLTSQPVGESDTLVLPDLAALVTRARQARDTVRARPEFDQFARMRDRIARQQQLSVAQERPRISTYARVGYGEPGLNFISRDFESYALGGVRLQWNAWTWGSGGREREALAIQQRVVAADEAAFARSLTTSIEGDETAIDRLQRTLASDDRIVTLREQVERSTQVRLQEGVVTASEYLDRSAELLQARFARAGHEVELAQAGAHLLTTLGLEVR
ncbi:MAG TPA: TolC family protein [Vicinamibacterales bacterium]